MLKAVKKVQEDCHIPERLELWTKKQFIFRSTILYIYVSVPYTFLSLRKLLCCISVCVVRTKYIFQRKQVSV